MRVGRAGRRLAAGLGGDLRDLRFEDPVGDANADFVARFDLMGVTHRTAIGPGDDRIAACKDLEGAHRVEPRGQTGHAFGTLAHEPWSDRVEAANERSSDVDAVTNEMWSQRIDSVREHAHAITAIT